MGVDHVECLALVSDQSLANRLVDLARVDCGQPSGHGPQADHRKFLPATTFVVCDHYDHTRPWATFQLPDLTRKRYPEVFTESPETHPDLAVRGPDRIDRPTVERDLDQDCSYSFFILLENRRHIGSRPRPITASSLCLPSSTTVQESTNSHHSQSSIQSRALRPTIVSRVYPTTSATTNIMLMVAQWATFELGWLGLHRCPRSSTGKLRR